MYNGFQNLLTLLSGCIKGKGNYSANSYSSYSSFKELKILMFKIYYIFFFEKKIINIFFIFFYDKGNNTFFTVGLSLVATLKRSEDVP